MNYYYKISANRGKWSFDYTPGNGHECDTLEEARVAAEGFMEQFDSDSDYRLSGDDYATCDIFSSNDGDNELVESYFRCSETAWEKSPQEESA